jgi:threonine/homoserine/homoserine lactone efflux protein
MAVLDAHTLMLFLPAALAIALAPGPGLFYVAARALAGGRREGLLSSLGTALGGLVHVVALAGGLSALVMASAELFTALKLAGCLYLVWLGLTTIRQAGQPLPVTAATLGARRAFRDGVVVEALNPKTAAFFLAFIPQFADPSRGAIALQVIVLGALSVALNTAADLAVVVLAARARRTLALRPALMRRLRQGAGMVLCSLGLSLAFARRA